MRLLDKFGAFSTVLLLPIWEAFGSLPNVSIYKPKPEPRLRWIDAGSSVTDLDWSVSSDWKWIDKSVRAQVWIELPVLLGLKVSPNSIFKLEERKTVSVLTAETRKPKLTERFRPQDLNDDLENLKDDARVVGLELTFHFDTPMMILHEQCKKSEIEGKVTKGGAHPFFFLSAYCSNVRPEGLTLFLELSEDAEFVILNGTKQSLEVHLDHRTQQSQKVAVRQTPQDSVFEIEFFLKKQEESSKIGEKDKKL